MNLALLLLSACLLDAQDRSLLTLDEYVTDWKISKQFTIAVAEKMPEEHYGFRPTPEQMTFGAQMIHIGGSMAFRFAQLTGTKAPYDKLPEKMSKAEIVQFVGVCYDYVIALLPKITPEQMTKTLPVDWVGRPQVNGRQMMLNMFVHAAHHRSAAEMYLRLKGIKPPDYTF